MDSRLQNPKPSRSSSTNFPLQAPGIPAEFQLKGGDLVLDDLATHDTKWCKTKHIFSYVSAHLSIFDENR